MAGVAFAVEGDGVGFATESYASSALYATLASLSAALWRIRWAKPNYGTGILMDLTYLATLPPGRTVKSLCVAGCRGENGGVLVKFLMNNGSRTETLCFVSGPAKALHMSLLNASKGGKLPTITKAEDDRLSRLMPAFEDYDWNMQGELSRFVGPVRAISFTNAMCFEFVMQSGPPRRYTLPLNVARFLGEYMEQYKETFEHHPTDSSDRKSGD